MITVRFREVKDGFQGRKETGRFTEEENEIDLGGLQAKQKTEDIGTTQVSVP